MINFLPKKWAGNFYLGIIIMISIYEIFDNKKSDNNIKEYIKPGLIGGAIGAGGTGYLRLIKNIRHPKSDSDWLYNINGVDIRKVKSPTDYMIQRIYNRVFDKPDDPILQDMIKNGALLGGSAILGTYIGNKLVNKLENKKDK